MTFSMTGYAEYSFNTSIGSLRFELKSLNHRYLELNFKLPDWGSDLEISLREIARQYLGRGKVDCSLKMIEAKKDIRHLKLDFELIDQLITLSKEIENKIQGSRTPIQSIDLLKWPSVIKMEEYNIEILKDDILTGFNKVIEILLNNRKKEGDALAELMLERLQKMALLTKTLREQGPTILAKYRQKLLTRLQELPLEPDEKRLEQEMVYLANKCDIEEELDRFATHIDAAKKLLTTKEPVGKALDFLMQELNREANTIASKSIDSLVSEIAITLKVTIEQLREQVQNLV